MTWRFRMPKGIGYGGKKMGGKKTGKKRGM